MCTTCISSPCGITPASIEGESARSLHPSRGPSRRNCLLILSFCQDVSCSAQSLLNCIYDSHCDTTGCNCGAQAQKFQHSKSRPRMQKLPRNGSLRSPKRAAKPGDCTLINEGASLACMQCTSLQHTICLCLHHTQSTHRRLRRVVHLWSSKNYKDEEHMDVAKAEKRRNGGDSNTTSEMS